MAAVLRMPELAANTPEATLVEWLVAEGDKVAAGEPLATVETAKATVDIEAEVGGFLLRLVVSAGSEVAVGAPIAVVGEAGESLLSVELDTDVPAPGTEAHPVAVEPTPVGKPDPQPTAAAPAERIFASPLARKMAKDAGLALSEMVGTGPQGRIVRRDVDMAIANRESLRAEQPTAPAAKVREGITVIPHTRLRRAIAARLTESKQEAPHFYVRGAARVDALLALREQLNERGATRISVNDLLVMAVAKAHSLVPRMNVIWTTDAVHQFDAVDIAVAVATNEGLVTPVVRSVDSLNLSSLATSTRDLAERAREGSLRPDELVGGSITVTNLGMFGTEEFAAIINPPHASILAVGAARESVVVDNGQCVVARTMNLTLSVDHRPLDGMVAAQWMQQFIVLLEDPLRIVT